MGNRGLEGVHRGHRGNEHTDDDDGCCCSAFELVPNEVWFEVFLRLRSLRDVIAVSATCKAFNELMARPDSEIWRQLCYDWALELQQDRLKEKETHVSTETTPLLTWKELLKELYWNRPIKVMRYSTYNENYKCLVKYVSIGKDGMRVHIDERGDNSLGALQSPSSSNLHWNNARQRKPERCKWTIEDPLAQYEGWLLYTHIDCLFEKSGVGPVGFEYGWSGYDVCQLFVANEEFLKSNRLEHFVSYWRVDKSLLARFHKKNRQRQHADRH
eukprot:TRINITY_DN810_c0_g1_i1.p1 TRINITY_DN810_c0_g1~~TRINITY_DN810_c0_g1_i1.p1  ORF type:complete len:271 (-),score=32.00 TRINITY_DN810_c0_g1_i1:125-937(-)